MRACACVGREVLWGYSWGDYHVKRLAEAPSLFVVSHLPSLPSLLSDPFLAPSSFLSILPGPERPRRVTRSVTGITHSSSSHEPSLANEQKWLTLVARRNMSISRFSEKIWNGGLFITFTSQRSNLNRLYNPHFSEFRRKLWMRKKIEFIGRSWEFPLGGNGNGMLIKTKKYDKMRKEQKYEGEWRRSFGNLKRISKE